MNDLLASFVLEIDVNVGRFAPFRRDKALEQEIAAFGIDFGHTEAKTDGGIGGRTATLTENIFRTGEVDDVVDGQEIGRILQLRDQLEFVLDIDAHLVGNALRITAGGALIGEMCQRILGVVETIHLLIGIFVAQFVEREGKCLAERQCFFDRFRRIAEQPHHFFRWFQMAFGIYGEFAPSTIDGGLFANAGEYVGERADGWDGDRSHH